MCPCGASIEQPARGRPRKFCLSCRPRKRDLSPRHAVRPRDPRSGRCSGCGSPVYVSRSSAAEPYCLPCRRAGLAPSTARHGTDRRYASGCRCDTCRSGKARSMREYAARRRAAGRPIQRPGDLRECDHCSATFTARRDRRARSRYCGIECAKLAQGWDGSPSPRFRISPTLRTSIYERDGWVCQLCGDPVDPDAAPRTRGYASLDHVIPRSRGGSDEASNLRLAHMGCNADRGATVEAA